MKPKIQTLETKVKPLFTEDTVVYIENSIN